VKLRFENLLLAYLILSYQYPWTMCLKYFVLDYVLE
jgi:hypothetical protein